MGLDIFFHRFKNDSCDLKEIIDKNDEDRRAELKKVIDGHIDYLKKTEFGTKEYTRIWNSLLKDVIQFFSYQFQYESILSPCKLEEAEHKFKKIIDECYAEPDAQFRKVNFIYEFFSDRLEDEWCFVTKHDCVELIDRCVKVLKDNSLAEELLPTRDGYFFGSTEYDERYFWQLNECIYQIGKLLRDWKDDEKCYVYMDW